MQQVKLRKRTTEKSSRTRQDRAEMTKSCAKCHEEFDAGESWITALEKDWHKDCFVCDYCDKPFDSEVSLYKGSIPMHPHCERTKEIEDADTCTKCGKPLIPGKPIVNVGEKGQYHETCFVCTKCKKPFVDGSYISENDKPYHAECIGSTTSSDGTTTTNKHEVAKRAMNNLDEVCKTCGKEIVGNRKVNELGHFHPDCFICNTCDTIIRGNSYAVHPQTNMPMCQSCLQSLTTCDTCNKSIKGGKYYVHPKTDKPMCETCMQNM